MEPLKVHLHGIAGSMFSLALAVRKQALGLSSFVSPNLHIVRLTIVVLTHWLSIRPKPLELLIET